MTTNLSKLNRILLIIAILTLQAMPAFAGQRITSIIENYYPFYYEPKNRCGVIAPDGSSGVDGDDII